MTGDTNAPEFLISRLVDGAGSPEDWRTFRSMAERDPTLWRELAEWQQEHADLSAQVNALVAVADEIDVDVQSEITRRFSERTRLVATWGGWAAAAAIVLAWFTGIRTVPQVSSTGGANVTSLIPTSSSQTPADAFNEYLTKGKEEGFVVGEVPTRVLVNARQLKAGGYEVVYLRQVLERRNVRELSTLATDENGNRVAVPATPLPLYEIPPANGAGPY